MTRAAVLERGTRGARLMRNRGMVPFMLINATMFHNSWFLIVFTHSNQLAPLVVAGHLMLHFLLVGANPREVKFIAAVSAFGLLLDHIMFRAGLFQLAGASAPPPIWLTCLWPVLATTFCHAFSGLQQRLVLAAVLGAVGGTGSYIAGTRLTEVMFFSDVFGPAIIAVLWAGLFPALLIAAQRLVNINE